MIPEGYPKLPEGFIVTGIYWEEAKNVFVRIASRYNLLMTDHWDGFSTDPSFMRYDVLLDKS